MTRRLLLAVVIALSSAPRVSAAQGWSVEAQAGRLRAALDPAAPTSGQGVLGARYDRPDAGFRLSAGAPASQNPDVWGAFGAWRRAALRRSGFIAGVDLSGNGLLLQFHVPGAPAQPGLLDPPGQTPPPERRLGYAAAGQVLPLIGVETDAVRIHARAGASFYAARFGTDEARHRTTRIADVTISYQPAPGIALMPAVRHFRAEGEETSTYAGLTAAISRGPIGVWGTAGQWVAGPTEHTVMPPWSVGGSLQVHRRATVLVNARRDTFDPLFLSAPQTAWSVGLSVPIGPRPAMPAPPVPASYERGQATVRLAASAAAAHAREGTLAIAGDFNGWNPAPMRRVGDHWEYTVSVPPGVYHYAFVTAGGDWFVPEGVPGRKDDGMGGKVAVLVIQ